MFQKDGAMGAVRRLVEAGRGHGELVGDGDCKAGCSQVEQVIKDLF
jgi:hypothetical protein